MGIDHATQINELCRQKKEDLHLTYQQIAETTGLSVDTVSKYLTRTVSKAPSVYIVGRICSALGVSLDEYFSIPAERDPRAEELVSQLRTELDKRSDYIHRLQATVDEKNKLIEKQTDLLKRAHDINRRNSVIILVLVLLCFVCGAYALTIDRLAPLVGFLR